MRACVQTDVPSLYLSPSFLRQDGGPRCRCRLVRRPRFLFFGIVDDVDADVNDDAILLAPSRPQAHRVPSSRPRDAVAHLLRLCLRGETPNRLRPRREGEQGGPQCDGRRRRAERRERRRGRLPSRRALGGKRVLILFKVRMRSSVLSSDARIAIGRRKSAIGLESDAD